MSKQSDLNTMNGQHFFRQALEQLTSTKCWIFLALGSNYACRYAVDKMIKQINKTEGRYFECVERTTEFSIHFKNGSAFTTDLNSQYEGVDVCFLRVPWETHLKNYNTKAELEAKLLNATEEIAKLRAEIERLYQPGNAGAVKAEQHFKEKSLEEFE